MEMTDKEMMLWELNEEEREIMLKAFTIAMREKAKAYKLKQANKKLFKPLED